MMNEIDELMRATKACADRLQELCDTRLRGREAADAREDYQAAHAALLQMMNPSERTALVPAELRELSQRASEDWSAPRGGLTGGIVLGGPVVEWNKGTSQRQIAVFSIPRLPDDDPREAGDMQVANTLLAVACVNFVRTLIAREATATRNGASAGVDHPAESAGQPA